MPTQTFKNYLVQLLPEFSLLDEQQQESGFARGKRSDTSDEKRIDLSRSD